MSFPAVLPFFELRPCAWGSFSYYQVSQRFLVGLFLWSFYDGGSRENVALFGALTPSQKLFSHYPQ
ncbi:hypothetical protein HMPREF0083_04613 [Aneurinibacillus aneurinilyticus ATCC 12856]|uniref:Uncharacterized protein n=1 Tax=Aneurinibacillus aneurinilyticus ATCC 12856 TaxID=649747 RepID=U1WFM0_ANEAE|nr:hypothetical protein HMPREF0083_04613 [Aneurinibacillus aneurinilyticus ATCC 12856]